MAMLEMPLARLEKSLARLDGGDARGRAAPAPAARPGRHGRAPRLGAVTGGRRATGAAGQAAPRR